MKPGFDFYKLALSEQSLPRRKALVAKHGREVQSIYGDTFWTETLGERGKTALAFAKWLVEQGQDLDEDTGRGTAIHIAASSGNLAAVVWLIAEGADIHKKSFSVTPLEAAIAEISNIDLENAVPIVKALLAAGAKITQGAKQAAVRAWTEFDYSRGAMAPAFRKQCEAAANQLCKLMKVDPPAPRLLHDGKSKIAVPKGTLAKQFETLWNFLVPASGSAVTLQGEVIRLAGRINHELANNGGSNWDAVFYGAMAKAFPKFVARGTPVDAALLAEAKAFCKAPRNQDNANVLCKIAVAWVRANPTPIKLAKSDMVA